MRTAAVETIGIPGSQDAPFIAYQRAIGQGTRTRLIGREKGYHGVGFGGISVGGLVNNRRIFPQIPADHMRHTLDLERNAFSKGLPAHGIELAEDLERLVMLHGAETIAAVIVEPMSGSAGVILTPRLARMHLAMSRGSRPRSGGPFATGQYVLVEPSEEPDRVGLVRLGRCQACATRSGSGELVVLTGDTGEAWR